MKLLPKKIDNYLYEKVFPKLMFYIIKAVFATIKLRLVNDAKMWEFVMKETPTIFAFWHNRLAYAPFGYTYIIKKRKLAAMVSRSKDGRLVGELVRLFGATPVYGSTSKGGSEALREVIKYMKEDKKHCAITPDGPRGPMYEVHPGVISLAQATGAPIIALTYDVKNKIKLNTWDKFYVPLPFTRGIVYFDSPMYVPPNISDEQRLNYQLELQNNLNRICGITEGLIEQI